jgi:hypothetical protein
VRRYFGRITAHQSAAAEQIEWPQRSVERYFMAVAKPPALVRGGEVVSDARLVADAFSDFVWE